MGVLDPHPALLRRVDQEQSTQAPEGLAAEALLALLVEQQDPAPGVGHLGGGGQAGEAGSYDDDVGVHGSPTVRGHSSKDIIPARTIVVSRRSPAPPAPDRAPAA